VQFGGRQPVQRSRAQRGLAVDAPLAGVGRLGVRQVLPAHRRAHAVRADQQVRLGLPAVGEMQPHAVASGVVAGQLAAEDQPAVQPGGHHLPERLPVDRGGQRGGLVRVGRPGPALLVQHPEPLTHHRQPGAGLTAGGLERRERLRRQALFQRQPGPRVDVQPVALPPGRQVRIPLVDRGVDARLEQALGQAQAAQAAAGHGDAEPAHPSGSAGMSLISVGGSPVPVGVSPGCSGPAGGFPASGRFAAAASARVIACRTHQVAYVENE
jgi:hypothetical protein